MKRREQILIVSLEMFNSEGEANLSAVDIANEMDISPGNLYYHYKGKEEIVEALFDRFECSIRTLLQETLSASTGVEDMMAALLVMLEQVYQYRFFYRNSNDLVAKYPTIEKRFRRLIQQKHALVVSFIQHLLDRQYLDAEMVVMGGVEEIADSVCVLLTCYYEYQRFNSREVTQQQFVADCYRKIAIVVSPYAGKEMAMHISLLEAFLESQGS